MKKLLSLSIMLLCCIACKESDVEHNGRERPLSEEKRQSNKLSTKNDWPGWSQVLAKRKASITKPHGVIVFEGRRDHEGIGLFLMNCDGSELESKRLGGGAVYSNDGKQIAFTSFMNDSNRFQVSKMSHDFKNVIQLTTSSETDSKNPTWSADGKQLAIQTGDNNKPDIGILNADGSGLTLLVKHPEADSNPAWSPDGKQIAFLSYREEKGGIFLIGIDGKGLKRLTDPDYTCTYPAWSPDGEYLAFVREERVSGKKGWRRSLCLLEVKSSKWWALLADEDDLGCPSWSPEGDWITFWCTRDKKQDIYCIDFNGEQLQKLTDSKGYHFSPSWGKQTDIESEKKK